MMSSPARIFALLAGWCLLCSIAPSHAQERIAPPLTQLLANFRPDPQAEAEVLLRRTQIHLDEANQSQTRVYVAVYLNSDTAVRDYSQIGLSFNSHYETIALDFAQVRSPDGRLHPVQADATQIQSPVEENFYHDRQELLFSLPNVRVGSVIEFQFVRTDSQSVIPGHWFEQSWFHWWEGRAAGQGVRADAVRTSELVLDAPLGTPLYWGDTQRYGARFERRTQGDRQQLSWHLSQLPAVVLQDNMPRERSLFPLLRISSLEGWGPVAQWAEQLITPHLRADAQVEQLAADIARQHRTPEARVRAVYQTLQEQVRYVFAHVGRGGYEPHSAFDVLAKGYGDCKDQSVLAVTLLRQLGLEAYPALISTRSRGLPDTDIASVNFDHMIVYLPAQAGMNELWLDTTGDSNLFPGNASALAGQPALVISPDSQRIVHLPEQSADQHLVHFTLNFDTPQGSDLQARFELVLGGMFEEHLRSLWLYSPERDKLFREMVTQLYPGAEVLSLQGHNADDLWQGFHLSGTLGFKRAWEGERQALSYNLHIAPMLSHFSNLYQLYPPADRRQAFVLDPGFTLRTQVHLRSPSSNHRPEFISRGIDLHNRYFRLSQSSEASATGVTLHQTLQVPPLQVAPADYPQFFQEARSLQTTPAWLVSFQYDASAARLQALKDLHPEEGADRQIALTRHHLRQGAFELALESAQQAVHLAPDNGEAHYVLGLSQGYRNLLNESDRSFARAEALGYRP